MASLVYMIVKDIRESTCAWGVAVEVSAVY